VAREATNKEDVNWRNWFVRSRLEARNGDAEAALRSYREAKSLNPRSGLFAQ
jgi:cytochrome c-type biogenesis protein CcmH/NrfG